MRVAVVFCIEKVAAGANSWPRGGAFGAVIPAIFLFHPDFAVPRKVCFKHLIEAKFFLP